MKIKLIIYIVLLTTFLNCYSETKIEVLEMETEYIFESSDKINFKETRIGSKKVKLNYSSEIVKIDPSSKCVNPKKYFTYEIVEAIKNDEIKVFAFENQKKEISFDEINSKYIELDTIITFDPETYEENLRLRRKELSELIRSFKIKQRWYINQSNDKIYNEIVSIIPLVWIQSSDKIFIKEEVCIIKNPKKSKEPNLIINNPNISWIKKTRKDNEINSIDFKNEQSKESLNNLFFNLPTKGEIDVYYPNKESKCSSKMSISNFNKTTSELLDTIVLFDENTYEEYIQVHKKKIQNIKDLNGITIEQLWYYNSTEKSLNSKILEISPFIFKTEFRNNNRLTKRNLFQIKL